MWPYPYFKKSSDLYGLGKCRLFWCQNLVLTSVKCGAMNDDCSVSYLNWQVVSLTVRTWSREPASGTKCCKMPASIQTMLFFCKTKSICVKLRGTTSTEYISNLYLDQFDLLWSSVCSSFLSVCLFVHYNFLCITQAQACQRIMAIECHLPATWWTRCMYASSITVLTPWQCQHHIIHF